MIRDIQDRSDWPWVILVVAIAFAALSHFVSRKPAATSSVVAEPATIEILPVQSDPEREEARKRQLRFDELCKHGVEKCPEDPTRWIAPSVKP